MVKFRDRVVTPALNQLQRIPRDLIGGPKKFMTQIARDNSHNSLCYEMRLSFALAIGAAFERNLRLWLSLKQRGDSAIIEHANRTSLFDYVLELKGLRIASLIKTQAIAELWELVSTARHGDGPAAKRLRELNPNLWPYRDRDTQLLYERIGLRAYNIRVQDSDIERYFDAVIGFWNGVGYR